MKKLIPIIFLLLCVLACKNKETVTKMFTKEMLPTQSFEINTAKDTILKTVHGSVVQITAGSFSISGNIQIQIKEAFTAAEILAAGLITESNGRPLRSAGMIYINALLNDKAVELIKPVKISMPNNYFEEEMKVFKGVENDSGTVNWVDPIIPDTTPQSNNWAMGKALFQGKCASCHHIFKTGTGPSLIDVEYRGPWRDRRNTYAFINNPSAFMAKDRYTQNLKAEYASMMTGFPDLGKEGVDAVLDYIKNESARPDAMLDEERFRDSLSNTKPIAAIDSLDYRTETETTISAPCKDDTVYIALPKQNQSFLINNKEIDAKYDSSILPINMEELRNGFTDPNPTSGMYDFEIKTLGWYNVDAYVEGYAGTENIKLAAQVRVDFEITMHVYLFCPKSKMLSVGNDKKGDTYHFNKINNGIPLFINDRAILFAFGSKGDKMYYGISEFRVKGEQTITIQVKETSEEVIREALYTKEIEGIDLGIEKKETKIIKGDCDTNLKTDTVKAK